MSLLRRLVLGDLDLTDYPFSIEFGGDLGSPENVYDVLVSLLSDGEISTSERVTNRSLSFTVLVEGPTLGELAIHEATLIAECDKDRNTLLVDPGDTYAVSSVFDTFRVQATLQYDDDLEQANFRRYQLTIPASPYPRGANLVVTPAAVAASETVVADGTSTTGWSAASGTVTTVSGAIVNTYTGPATNRWLSRNATLTLSGNQLLAVTWKPSGTLSATPSLYIGGVFGTQPEVSRTDAGSGYSTSFFQLPNGVPSAPAFTVMWSTAATGSQTFSIDKVSLWTGLPFIGTARQKALSLIPGGSVRTQGSLHVTHATSPLGKTIVYTHRSGTGYLPPLSPWWVSGETRGTDAARLSGKSSAIAPAVTTFRVPVSVLPEGRVEIWAWLGATGSSGVGAINWTLTSWMGGTQLSYEVQADVPVTFPATNTWYLLPIGVTTMPPVKIGPSGYIEVRIHEPSVTRGIYIDEAYLFATDKGRLTVVDCGTGTAAAGGPSRHLWIDAPSLEEPMGAIYRGHSTDRSDAFHAGPDALPWGVHDFDPAGTNVFVATQNATDASTSLTHYRRWHTNGGS